MTAGLRRSPFPELGVSALAAVLLIAYEYLDRVARAQAVDPLVPFIEEGTGVMCAGLLFFAVRRLARRYPLLTSALPRRLAIHACGLIAFSLAHTTLNWTSREVLFRLVGLGDYDYGIMPVRYLMEFPIDVILYSSFVGGVWMVDRWRAERARAVASARLETQLSAARLENLRLQLQPHFLFNALNTISSAMYDDPAAADTMLARLADLLRYALGTADTQEVPLAAELDALDHYLAIVDARFGTDFACVRDIDPAARRALVPALLLQPLVENAVRHGRLAREGRGRALVRVARDTATLIIDVEDDGESAGETGWPARTRPTAERGLGLAATAERLRLLYGAAHRFEYGPVATGFRVTLTLPWRLAEPGAAAIDELSHARVDC